MRSQQLSSGQLHSSSYLDQNLTIVFISFFLSACLFTVEQHITKLTHLISSFPCTSWSESFFSWIVARSLCLMFCFFQWSWPQSQYEQFRWPINPRSSHATPHLYLSNGSHTVQLTQCHSQSLHSNWALGSCTAKTPGNSEPPTSFSPSLYLTPLPSLFTSGLFLPKEFWACKWVCME